MSLDATDDAALIQLAAEAGIAGGPAALRDLLLGSNAAPPDADPDAWLALVAPGAPPALADRLRRLKAALAPAPVTGAAPRPVMAARLDALRAELARQRLDGFVVPRADEHQGEYVPARAERLAWITGFTGSAGLAVILAEAAALFVDGRYTLQAEHEVDTTRFALRHLIDDPHADWVTEHLPSSGALGYDPWLHTVSWVEKMRKAVEGRGGTLVPVEANPIDAVWTDQPPPPLAPVVPHDLAFAGVPSIEKRTELGEGLARRKIDAAVLTAPDSIAWLLNIRGGDVPHSPLPLSFAVLAADGGVELFIDRRKLVPGLEAHLGNHVTIRPPEALGYVLDRLGADARTVQADPGSASAWIFDRLHRAGATVRREADPCALPKARKNAAELAGARAAHARDGAAVCRFLAWLARTAPGGAVTEIGAARQLLAFRAAGERFRDISFDTISGAGPNGAIVHYRVSEVTNRRLEPGALYLIDSGAQYLDGTTDITRTVAIGEPAAEMRERFTLVLKGHIAVATARFPRGTTGSQLDSLARQHLWSAGLDFDHGTGHGVGSYLGVHEGPQRISKLPNPVALEPGMILSDEPGYYRAGAYGIRIENLLAVRDCAALAGAERPMLEFETLTLAPIDLTLVEPGLLTAAERAWLDAYHRRVREEIGPRLDAEDRTWLAAATEPLSRQGRRAGLSGAGLFGAESQ